MKKQSRKKLFIWIGSILGSLIIIICVGGYFAINYAADKVLDSMMNEALDSVNTATPTSSSTESHSPSPSPIPTSSDRAEVNPEAPSALPDITQETGQQPVGSKKQDKPSGSKVNNSPGSSTSPSLPPSAPASPSPSSSPNYQAEISVDKADEVKDNISFAEKTKVLTVMLKRLSASDIKTLQQLADGGLTVEKKVEAKEIILQKLTEDEYNDLIAIAKKYGLSQGKNYKDSQKEFPDD